jgi:hypothetical protein
VTELKNRRYIAGCISCMPLIVTVNTIAECPRTDCNIYWEEGGGYRGASDTTERTRKINYNIGTKKWHH